MNKNENEFVVLLLLNDDEYDDEYDDEKDERNKRE